MSALSSDSAVRRRGSIAPVLIVLAMLVLLSGSVAAGVSVRAVAGLVIVGVLLVRFHERLLSLRSLVCLTILTILFVPIKRYSLPAGLPINLELYRLVVAWVFAAWLTALLIDPNVRFRRSGFEGPVVAFCVTVLLSLLANPARVNSVGADAIKALTFFASFILVFYIVVSVARKATDIDFLVGILASGGAALGLLAVFETVTGVNVFDHLHSLFPVLQYDASQAAQLSRNGHVRAMGSGQHPIAFGAALAMLLPLAVYRARASAQTRWWFVSLVILMGILATRSRTGILMLIVIAVVYGVLRPRELRRLWPAVIPLLLLIHLALPGTLGTIKESFFPKGGLVAQQSNANVGSGRVATLGPALHNELAPDPIVGEGFGTRVTTPDSVVAVPNAPILDDEWLGVLLETGLVGTAALLWLFIRSVRRMGRAAKLDASPRGALLVSTTGAVVAYATGMLTYDAFSFIQVTFLLFILLGIGAATLASPSAEWETVARVRNARNQGLREVASTSA